MIDSKIYSEREQQEREVLGGVTAKELRDSVVRWKQTPGHDLLMAAASILSNGHHGALSRERIDVILNRAKTLIFDAMDEIEKGVES